MTKPNIKTLWAHITNRWSRNWQKVEYIVLHYVGAVSSAEANARYLNRDGNLGWSAHFFTDQYSIWQSVPLDESAATFDEGGNMTLTLSGTSYPLTTTGNRPLLRPAGYGSGANLIVTINEVIA